MSPSLPLSQARIPLPLALLERALCEGMWTHVRRLAVIFLHQPLSWILWKRWEGGTGERRRRRPREMEADRGWRQGMGPSVAAPRPHHRRTAGRRPRDLSRWIGPFGRRRHNRPLHRPLRPLSVGGVSKWGVSDCRVVLSKLAIDVYTPLCTSLCFGTLFSAMVFTVCSCSLAFMTRSSQSVVMHKYT